MVIEERSYVIGMLQNYIAGEFMKTNLMRKDQFVFDIINAYLVDVHHIEPLTPEEFTTMMTVMDKINTESMKYNEKKMKNNETLKNSKKIYT